MGTDCRLCPKTSGDNGLVCQPCADACRTELLHVTRELAQELDDALSGTTTGTATGNRSSRSADPPLPISTAVTEARTHLHAILAGWGATVRDDIGGLPPVPELVPLASYLSRHTGLMRHAEYGPDAVREIRAAYRQAVRAVDLPVRRVPLPTRCPATVLDDQTGQPRPCGGKLHMITAPGLSNNGEIRCNENRDHTVPAIRMIHFAKSIAKARRRA